MGAMKWSKNQLPKTEDKHLSLMSKSETDKARAFHRSFPQYDSTPLHNLKNAAAEMGIAGLYVKDESYRFGLNAFKVLGGSYAIGKFVAQKLGKDISEIDHGFLTSDKFKADFPPCTFFTAT
ncbi:MAG: diaminopropionate ammonia-lyase, partial [Oscillospiraceae bacterium]|nr:diaminopropionate ammonia-lyase [Oscillospiraceae bacterium]